MISTIARRSLITAIALGVTTPVVAITANDYMIRVPLKDKLSTWNSAESLYEPWVNNGNHYDCNAWTPDPSSVDFGSGFLQSRHCKQDQSRLVTEREFDTFSSAYRVSGTYIDSQTISEIESQNKVGERRDWQSTESTFTSWSDVGETKNYSVWSPAVSSQTTDFSQSRNYNQGQERFEQKREKDSVTGDIRNVGSLISRLQDDPRVETRSVSVSASAWANTTKTGYSSWSPAYGAQTSNYTQSRSYTQNQSRTWTYKADSDTLSTRVETQAITGQTETQPIAVSVSAWANTGDVTGCTAWSPLPSDVDYGTAFTQSRTCEQAQTRTYTHKLGATSVYTRGDSQAVNVSQSQSATGTKLVITPASSSWTNWSTYSTSSGSYSPSASTQTGSFTQSRSVTYYQERYEQPRQYRNGVLENAGSTIRHTQSVSGSDSRTVYVSSSTADSGGVYSCGSYSPATSTVNYGTSFTQSRTCSQGTRTTYAFSIGGSHYTSSSRSVTQSATATGTKTVIAGASSSWTGWSNYSTSYGSYSPAASTQTSGFTQSRSVTNAQERYEQARQYRNGVLENVGSPIRHVQSVAGTAQSRYVSVSSSTANYGGVYSCGNWSPSAETITNGQTFTQTRSCRQGTRTTYSFSIGGSHYTSASKFVTDSQTNRGSKAVCQWSDINNCSWDELN